MGISMLGFNIPESGMSCSESRRCSISMILYLFAFVRLLVAGRFMTHGLHIREAMA